MTAPNFVKIDAVVLITWNFKYFCPFGLKTPIHAPKIGVLKVFHPQNGDQYQRNPQKGTSVGRIGSRGALIMSLSAIFLSTFPEKSRGKKVWWRRGRRMTHFWPFWHHYKMAVPWLYATLLISICSYCRGQHADVNIWSVPLLFHFSGVAKNRP